MSDAIKSLTLIQIGEETTRGTEVNANRRILTKEATYRFNEEMESFLEQMHGTLTRSAVDPIVVRNGTEFEISNDLDFEQILLFLLSGYKGAVTPTTPGTGEARLWTFTPSVTADPAIDTYTIEFEESDGSNVLEQQALYGFTTGFSIAAGLEGIPQLSASMVARKTSLGTKTAGVSLPTVTYAPNGRWAVYIDSSWANLGTTQITGQIHSIDFTFGNFLYPKYTLDNRSDLDFTKYAWRQRLVNVTMQVSVDPNSGLVPDEDGNKSAGTKRFVRDRDHRRRLFGTGHRPQPVCADRAGRTTTRQIRCPSAEGPTVMATTSPRCTWNRRTTAHRPRTSRSWSRTPWPPSRKSTWLTACNRGAPPVHAQLEIPGSACTTLENGACKNQGPGTRNRGTRSWR